MVNPVAAATPLETYGVAAASLSARPKQPLKTMVVSGMVAGALIALGFVFYVTTQTGVTPESLPYGMAKLIGGLVFSVGLAMVIITGADLFTSTTMTSLLAAEGKLRPSHLLRHWVICYCSNMAGALLVALVVLAAGTANQANGAWGAVVLKTATAKVSYGPMQAFFLGILCNVMVCLGVWLAYAGRTIVDKIVAMTLPIALFVASGFEHSVANMFMIPMGLLLKAFGSAKVIEAAHGLDMQGLTLSGYLVHNLAPVTAGNIVGGWAVALTMWVWHAAAVRREAENKSAVA